MGDQNSEYKILSGNELVVQGALEGGFNLLTGYPGSPLADFFNILYKKKKHLEPYDIKVVIGNSEAHAAAMASGAKMAQKNAIVVMKSMGLHVASDPLSVGQFANPGKGVVGLNPKSKSATVIVVGDDPWSMSTSTPADSRYLFQHLHIPFLVPTNPQEVIDWIKGASELSKKTSLYIGVLLTTPLAEGGGWVKTHTWKNQFGGSEEKRELDPRDFNLQENVMVPPNSLHADKNMILNRFPKLEKELEVLKLSEVYGDPQSPVGILALGQPFQMAKEYLEKNNCLDKVALIKLSCPYPLEQSFLLNNLKNIKNLLVIEEKRGFLEEALSHFCFENNLSIHIRGKEDTSKNKWGFKAYGGIDYEEIEKNISQFLQTFYLGAKEISKGELPCLSHSLMVPPRLPTFCPGCPHRETLSLLKELRQNWKEDDLSFISHGDVGCYSLSFLEPFKEMHDLSAMGQGGALSSGADIFSKNPSLVLMGDSTFFHSGMAVISNSIQMDHHITYIILDNDNTAMTGHQMTPVTGISVEGASRPKQSISQMVKAMGVNDFIEVNPSDRYFYKNLLKEYINKPGTKVIVSVKECALTFKAKQRKFENHEKKQRGGVLKSKVFYQINAFACEDCRVCVDMTGCPGLTLIDDVYESKVQIDQEICISDSYCTMMKACPSFEKIECENWDTNKTSLNQINTLKLEEPKYGISLKDLSENKSLRMVVSGVGGTGVKTVSNLISQVMGISKKQECKKIQYQFFDQKGLAQRNGAVTSHLSFFPNRESHSVITPKGLADIVIATDLLEGLRSLSFLKIARENTDEQKPFLISDSLAQMTMSELISNEAGDKNFTGKKEIRQYLTGLPSNHEVEVYLFPFKKFCHSYLGRNVYAPTMILGYLFQKGLLPFYAEEFEAAINVALPSSEVNKNMEAFQKGRELFLIKDDNFCDKYQFYPDVEKYEDLSLFESSIKHAFFMPWERKKALNNYHTYLKKCESLGDHKSFFERILHDIVIYDSGHKLGDFFKSALALESIYPRPLLKNAWAQLASTYFIKDEVYISHVLSGPIKKAKDTQNFSSAQKFKVIHINRPHFDVGPFKFEFDLNSKPWMLKLMKHMRFLRKVLPQWHRNEKDILTFKRKQILGYTDVNSDSPREYLRKIRGIKGYREVLFKNHAKYLKENKIEK